MRPFITLKPLEQRIKGEGLYIDSVPLSDILDLKVSPIYVTSLNSISQRLNYYKSALQKHFTNFEVFYAMKANFSFPILEEIKNSGGGIDIVSIGEWRAALKAGIKPEKICFAGVGKKEEEWKEAIKGGLGYLSVEHLSELNDILFFIYKNKSDEIKSLVISLRLNPSVEVETHPHLKTGALNSKFGILFEHFEIWLNQMKSQFQDIEDYKKWIRPLKGIHVHVGSQLMENSIFPLIANKILDCAHFMLKNNIIVKHIDFGGGLGVPVEGVPENGNDIKSHIDFLCNTFKNAASDYKDLIKEWGEDFNNLFVCVEPGRSIVASSTVFITQVLYEKQNSDKNLFCYVDGAMNDFPRPSLYGAIHHAEIVNFNQDVNLREKLKNNFLNWNIVGPVCESGDFLSKNTLLPEVQKGDIIAFFEAGAYCRSMASTYNLRSLTSEVFVKDGKILHVIQG
jgi:diaminopimelate decarboxylase